MQDPFFDDYRQEVDTACSIIELVDRQKGTSVTLMIDKVFLKRIIHSHISYIRSIEQDAAGHKYAH